MYLPAPLAAARNVFSTFDHTVASFALYSIVFVLTVASLRGTEEELRFQISQLCWSIAAICLTVMQMKWSVFNTYHGLFWIVFPAFLVACNDCGAYIAGKSCGKRFTTRTFFPLSPNKTWEGFIGAAVFTCIAGFYLPLYLAQFDWLRCSFVELQLAAAASGGTGGGGTGGGKGGGGGDSLTCEISSLFTPSSTMTVPFIMSATPMNNIERFGLGQIAPIQVHGVIMGLFASLVAPFGGLFASVVKRAYGLKDFDNLIPGHGGFMDRLDCQMVMILFTFVYLTSFVLPQTNTSSSSLSEIINSISVLHVKDRQHLMNVLQKMIVTTTTTSGSESSSSEL